MGVQNQRYSFNYQKNIADLFQFNSWIERQKSPTIGLTTEDVYGKDTQGKDDDDIKFKALKAGTTKITCRNTKTDKKINFKITVKNVKKTTKASSQNKTICAKGSLKRSIRVNGELELEVKKTKGKGVKDRQLKWTVEDSSVLAFEDMDDGIYDDEMEFVGIKPGKTTVTCTNTANKEKVTFTITVK